MYYKTNIQFVVDFLQQHPECKNLINVDTRFGYKQIQEASITAKNEQVYKVTTNSKKINASGHHKLLSTKGWKKIIELNPKDVLLTKTGKETIIDIKETNIRKDLMDLQVADVHEFYANNIVSHNSAIADALYFAIFGTPLRDIRVENIPNWKTREQCEISLKFSVFDSYVEKQYRIDRTLNPSRVQLYEDKKNISRTIAKTNSMLSSIIGTSPELFEQAIIMSLNQTEPFLAKKPTTKRKFIEGIFKLDIFSHMLMVIRHDINEATRQYSIEKTRKQEVKHNLARYDQQQKEYVLKKKERLLELAERQKENTRELNKLKRECKTNNFEEDKLKREQQLVETKEKIKHVTKQQNDTIHKNSAFQTTILNFKNNISELEQMGHDVCVTCKRKFTKGDIKSHDSKKSQLEIYILEIEEKIQKLNAKTLRLKKRKQELEERQEKLVIKIHSLVLLESTDKTIRDQLEQRIKRIKENKEDITRLKNEQSPHLTLINETSIKLVTIEKAIKQLDEKQDILDIAKYVTSEEGVKSFIVRKMLEMLNNRLNYYLQKLDANCICTFNEYFEETIVNEKGKQVSYFNFSGGERKRIDLAMLFTFLDIRRLQSNIAINVSFYDELLDTSLDTKGIECVLDILKDRISDYDEAVYIISHKNQAIKHATGEIVYLEKENEVTRRLSYGT